jgi:phosphatidylinositol N-acetylglucosaminyltransferase subunit A
MPKKITICIVSDFFYPGLGGVEKHQFQLASLLIDHGYKVVVITKTYKGRQGVRYMNNGIKVYHLPYGEFIPIVVNVSLLLPTALFRYIFIREEVDLVHAHHAPSTLGMMALQAAYLLGLKTAFTDHSLFGYTDVSDLMLSMVNKVAFCNLDVAIGVSHISKVNLSLRAYIDPNIIFSIPNAVDFSDFIPDPSQRSTDRIVIVSISRHTYRKGTDLLVEVIPQIIKMNNNVDFIIGGDGEKFYLLEEMRDKYNLHKRVTLLGNVEFKDVRNVLVKGHIFLNTSLTEAFCIAILEAASCGLLVVSTNVGGITEVLPKDMIYLADPKDKSLIKATQNAIADIGIMDSNKMHERVKELYSWESTTLRVVNL